MTIGDRLKYIRIQRKKTLEEVAAAVGVNPTSISKYETNRIKNIPRKSSKSLPAILTSPFITFWD
ncbi:helix-turn-helix domain-containing protein [Allobaculum sp. Allo2]|uniref:helix-turn-helix domain-containing protein n=1 Tax=Allobaculum sp. Allo2 TaxID=2853432 RepID=UPI001F614CDF|nr:helix-turn-helix transcriptional regulator [Allobaculum sp. Allo2]UNT92944.1 helix-turn-helix domain-containing protein [Allobaculum sp. Allo2]